MPGKLNFFILSQQLVLCVFASNPVKQQTHSPITHLHVHMDTHAHVHPAGTGPVRKDTGGAGNAATVHRDFMHKYR